MVLHRTGSKAMSESVSPSLCESLKDAEWKSAASCSAAELG